MFFEWNDENKKCKTHFWRSIKRLVNKYKRYNLGMNIESMSGRSPKKVKGSGRPKRQNQMMKY